MYLTTDRLILRPIEPNDFQDLYDIFSDKEVTGPAQSHCVESLDEMSDYMYCLYRDYSQSMIELKSTGQVIGVIQRRMIYTLSDNNDYVIGYMLRRDMHGKGYMTEAVKAVVTDLFERRDAESVALATSVYNRKSQRVAEKCGFSRINDIRDYPYWFYEDDSNDCHYKLTYDDYSFWHFANPRLDDKAYAPHTRIHNSKGMHKGEDTFYALPRVA